MVFALARIHRDIFGGDIVAMACLGTAGAMALYHRLVDRTRLIHLAAALVAIYVPLLFATFVLRIDFVCGMRLALFPAWILIVGLTHLAAAIWEKGNRKTACAMMIGFLAVTTATSVRHLPDWRNMLTELDVQTAFIRKAGPASAIFPTDAFQQNDANMYRRFALLDGRMPSNIVFSRDDLVPEIESYWAYDSDCRCMRRLTDAQIRERLAKIVHFTPDNAPLALLARFQAEGGRMTVTTIPGPRSTCQVSLPGAVWDCPEKSEFEANVSIVRYDLSRIRIHTLRNDGLAASSPFMAIPRTGDIQWERGVFLPSRPASSAQPVGCHVDSPAQTKLDLVRTAPWQFRGWLNAPHGVRPDAVPFAALSGADGKYYAASLYREMRPDAGSLAIGGQILDANLTKVAPGNYRLLLGIERSVCDTGTTIALALD